MSPSSSGGKIRVHEKSWNDRFMMQKISFLMFFVLLFGWTGSIWADLVGYWALDGDATDSSSYGNDGTINGSVAPVADRFGNPSGDKISVGDPPEFNITGAMTIVPIEYNCSTTDGLVICEFY